MIMIKVTIKTIFTNKANKKGNAGNSTCRTYGTPTTT